MTDRDVDAMAIVEGIREVLQEACRYDDIKCIVKSVRLIYEESIQNAIAKQDAQQKLAEARQQLAAQAQEITELREARESIEQFSHAKSDAITRLRQEREGLKECIFEAEGAADAAGRPGGERLSESIEALAQEIARLQEELDRTVRCTDDCERVRKQDAQDAADAQRERDAQIVDARADVLTDSDHFATIRFDDLIYELRACAAAIRAARTPQEPT